MGSKKVAQRIYIICAKGNPENLDGFPGATIAIDGSVKPNQEYLFYPNVRSGA